MIAAVVVHALVVLFAIVYSWRGSALGDIAIYRGWAASGFVPVAPADGPAPTVYPILATLPMALAQVLGERWFFAVWAVVVAVLNILGLAALTRRSNTTAGVAAGWWWLLFTGVMGVLAFSRIDGVTAPLVLMALAFGLSSPGASTALLAVGAWIKVWPVAVVTALLIAVRRRATVLAAGVAVSLGAGLLAVVLNWGPHVLDFLGFQGNRGMQAEATFSLPWMWLAALGLNGTRAVQNVAIGSLEVQGPGTEVMAGLMQPLLVVAVGAVAALALAGLRTVARRDGDRTALMLWTALSLTAVLIVFNKVGSPQFVLWLGPVVAAGLAHDWIAWRRAAWLVMATAAVTLLVFPVLFQAIVHAQVHAVLVLTVRDLLLLAVLVLGVSRLVRIARGPAREPLTQP